MTSAAESIEDKIRKNIKKRSEDMENYDKELSSTVVCNKYLTKAFADVGGIEKALLRARLAKIHSGRELQDDAYSHLKVTKANVRLF